MQSTSHSGDDRRAARPNHRTVSNRSDACLSSGSKRGREYDGRNRDYDYEDHVSRRIHRRPDEYSSERRRDGSARGFQVRYEEPNKYAEEDGIVEMRSSDVKIDVTSRSQGSVSSRHPPHSLRSGNLSTPSASNGCLEITNSKPKGLAEWDRDVDSTIMELGRNIRSEESDLGNRCDAFSITVAVNCQLLADVSFVQAFHQNRLSLFLYDAAKFQFKCNLPVVLNEKECVNFLADNENKDEASLPRKSVPTELVSKLQAPSSNHSLESVIHCTSILKSPRLGLCREPVRESVQTTILPPLDMTGGSYSGYQTCKAPPPTRFKPPPPPGPPPRGATPVPPPPSIVIGQCHVELEEGEEMQ